MARRLHLSLCRRAGRAAGAPGRGAAMFILLLNVYLAILFLLVWFKLVPFNLFWKSSPFPKGYERNAGRSAHTIGTVVSATQATTASAIARPITSPSRPNSRGPVAPAAEPPV